MSHIFLKNEKEKYTGHVACYPVYEFEGFRFQFNPIFGAEKLNKDGTLSARTGKKFWKAFQRWFELPEQELEKYRVE